MAALCLLDENGRMAERWEIGEAPLAVGRDKSADITISDGALSRRHFLVKRTGDAVTVQDLQSQNGTWVAGKRATSAQLKHHDCIVAGRTVFLFDAHAQFGTAAADLSVAPAMRHAPASASKFGT